MSKVQELQNKFNKQMKKQRYDNSGRKEIFIDIAAELFQIVEEQQKEIEQLKGDVRAYKYQVDSANGCFDK